VCGEPGFEYTTGLVKGKYCNKHYFIKLLAILSGTTTIIAGVIYLLTNVL
jgi:hypothetical protein